MNAVAYLLIERLVMFEKALQCLQHLYLAGHSALCGSLPFHHGHAQRPLVSRHQTLQMFQQQLSTGVGGGCECEYNID